MRKRIICIALMSALVIGVFAGSALAGDFYQLTSLAISAKSETASAYASPYTLTGTIKLTAGTAYQSATDAPSGFNSTNKITWTLSCNPTDMESGNNKLALSSTSTNIDKTATKTYDVTLSGKVMKPGTVTITATQGTNKKEVTFKVNIPDKTAPTIPDATLPVATAGASYAKQTISLKNFPEDVTIDLSSKGTDPYTITATGDNKDVSYSYYGLTFKVNKYDSTATSNTATTARAIEIGGSAPNFATDKNGLTIKVTAKNAKAFSKGTNTSTKTYTLVVKPIAPTKFDTRPTDNNKYDLSEKVNSATNKITPGGKAFTTGKIELTHATLPITFTATGLPTGLVISQSAGLDATKNASGKGTATAYIKGTPTKAGEYNNIVVTATNTSGDSYYETYTMTVLYSPVFTTTSIPQVTWDKAYTTTLKASGAIDGFPVSFDVLPTDKDKLPKGLSLDKDTGIFKGVFSSPDISSGFAFGSDGEKKINITFRARNKMAIVPKSFDIVVKAVKPVIEKQGALQNNLDKMKLTYNKAFTFLVSADGPGTIKWDVPTLPPGVTSSSTQPDTKKAVSVLKLTGTPTITTKNFNVKTNPLNGAGSTSFALKFNVGYDSVDVKYNNTAVTTKGKFDSTKIAKQTKKVGDTLAATAAVFTAEPGPINWAAKNLPSGIKLSIDKSVSYDRKAVLVGEFKSATKLDKNGKSVYTITAKNTVTGKSVTISADLKVYAEPKITTSSLPRLTTGKPYSAKIQGTGSTASKDLTWTVTMAAGSATSLPAGKGLPTTKGASLATFQATGGSSKLTAEQDSKTGMITITGSLDRIPTGNIVKVSVKLVTPYDTTGVTRNLSIDVSGVAPKFVTSKLGDFKTSVTSSSKIVVMGTQPITMGAYIDPSSMAKIDTDYAKDGANEGESADLTGSGYGGFSFTPATNGEGTFTFTKGGNVAYNGLPITFWATNYAQSKPVLKVIKVNVKGAGIQIVDDTTSEVASPDITVFTKAGTAMTEQKFTLSGDINPFEVTLSPKVGTAKNGITTAVDATTGEVTISGTPTAGKETKTPVTITARNKSTNQKHVVKLTIVGQAAPEIKSRAQTKEVEVGKAISIKLQASGSKMTVSKATKEAPDDKLPYRYATKDVQYNPIKWAIADNSAKKVADLVALGLSFDANKGSFTGTTKTTTSKDNAYTPYVFTVKAINDAGDSETIDVTIGVKGKKMRFTHKQIVINKGVDGWHLSSPDLMLKTDIASQDTSAYVKYAWVGNTYDNYGFTKTIDRAGPDGTGDDGGNYGKLNGDFSDTPATKGVTLKISADNVGTTINGTIKVVINDPAPEIDGDETFEIQAEKAISVTETMEFGLKEDPTGDTKIKWSISQRPTHPILNVTLKPAADGKTALATLRAQKTSSTQDVTSVFSVAAQNTVTKEIGQIKVTVTVKGVPEDTEALPETKDALPEDKKTDEATEETAETETVSEEAEAEEEKSEGTVAYGDARTEEWLTADERAAIAEAGYVIAAVLPEVTADADGQYDLDAVTLSENAPEGESLVWFAFPRNAEKSDDDTIAEFYDEAGAEITAVPESRNVIVSPWLREGVTYAPVIAVKAPVTSETKDSLDEAEEGDTVTLEALEEAAENASDDEAPAEE